MTAYTDAPHHRARLRRPTAYRTTLATPRPYPRPVVLRSSCGHALGIGYVWRRQGFIVWRACR